MLKSSKVFKELVKKTSLLSTIGNKSITPNDEEPDSLSPKSVVQKYCRRRPNLSLNINFVTLNFNDKGETGSESPERPKDKDSSKIKVNNLLNEAQSIPKSNSV